MRLSFTPGPFAFPTKIFSRELRQLRELARIEF
jgi:hypothetical protein